VKKIVISGSRSNIGKTLLAEKILHSLRGWSALKVTVKKRTGCPRRLNCGVCSSLKGDFDLVTDKNIIGKEGTDTARLRNAGAKKVAWLKAKPKGLKRGLRTALSVLKNSKGVVIEGTSVLKFIKPDFTIFLKSRARPLRRGVKRAFNKADMVIDV